MRDTSPRGRLVVLWMVALALLPGTVFAQDIKLGEPMDFGNAGIRLAVPQGFTYVQPGEAFDVMRYAMQGSRRPSQTVSVSAFPVGEKTTAAEFADAMFDEVSKNLAIRDLKLLKKAALPVAGLSGEVRLLRYTFRGVPLAAARIFFVRDLPTGRIAYVLTVEAMEEKQGSLVPVFGAVIKSVSLIPIQQPWDAPLVLADRIEDHESEFSIRPPKDWITQAMPNGREIFLVDYDRGGVLSPVVKIVHNHKVTGTAQEVAKAQLSLAMRAAKNRSLEAKVLSEGPAKIGSLDGYQFVLEQYGKVRTASAPADEKTTMLIAQRTSFTRSDGENRSYTIVLVGVNMPAEKGEAMLDKICSEFKTLQPVKKPAESAPASGPAASAPAASRPAAP